MKIGFIGLGNMGGPMALNVARAGYSMTVHDLRQEAADPLLEMGASWADSPEAVARASDVVFTSLPGPPEVEAVALGDAGIIQGMTPGAVYIDLSTNSPSLVRRMAPLFEARGCHMLDAPVSGGVPGARAGKLAVMASGDESIYQKCKPVLDAIGDKVQYCGGIGNGTICKLMHNSIAYSYCRAIAECFTTAVKAGVDAEVVWRAVRDGAVGRGVLLDASLPRKWFSGNFEPDFALRLARKDVTLATDLGREYGVPMPFSNLVLEEMDEAMARGWGEKDSRIFLTLQEEKAGVEVRFKEPWKPG